VGEKLYRQRGHWEESLEANWISALCRVLIGIHRYQHGGAVLISDDEAGLKPKYSLRYDRLADALFRAGVISIKHTSYAVEAWSDTPDSLEGLDPREFTLDRQRWPSKR
jgi:hypothetical protein